MAIPGFAEVDDHSGCAEADFDEGGVSVRSFADDFENEILQVAVSNPFDTAMLNAVQFDARCPVQFALAPKGEIEKALKKYYGVGAETLDEMAKRMSRWI